MAIIVNLDVMVAKKSNTFFNPRSYLQGACQPGDILEYKENE